MDRESAWLRWTGEVLTHNVKNHRARQRSGASPYWADLLLYCLLLIVSLIIIPLEDSFGPPLSDFHDFLRCKPVALVPRKFQCFDRVLGP